MATTRQDISEWFDMGLSRGAKHMVIMCDTFSYEDYPVFTMTDEECLKRYRSSGDNMQRVMEVYDLNVDKEIQLNQHRAMSLPTSASMHDLFKNSITSD